MSYGISRRTNEIGIRMALGAGRATVHSLVLRNTLLLVATGAAAGLAAAGALARLFASVLSGMLFEMKPTDLGILTLAAIALIAVALLAASLPARRASRVDPMIALRYE